MHHPHLAPVRWVFRPPLAGWRDAMTDDLLRRQRELASLYATAKSLTALGELDEVLQSIVHHAHDLMGTDFTYLSLVGDDGAVARDNARLYEASRKALRELRIAYRKMERAQASHEALTGAVLEGGTPGDVAQLLADQLGGGVTLLDRTGTAVVQRESA